jgi:hypothetical protein
MHLLLAPFPARFVLVETGQIAIVAFVERLVLDRLEARLTKRGQHKVERVLGARQDARVSDIEFESLALQAFAARLRFGNAFVGETGVLPAGEQVLQIPLALPVADKHQNTVHQLLQS